MTNLNKGPKIKNTRDNEYLLHKAVSENNREAVKKLIAAGADINAVDLNGDSPLYIALDKKYKDIAKHLITAGADINAKDATGTTPLEKAIARENVSAIETLMLLGANADCRNKDGLSPLLYLILKEKNPKFENKDPVYAMAYENNLNIVAQILIKAGANVNAKDNYNTTPLHLAVVKGYPGLAIALIEAGADVNAKDNSGFTPLYLAFSKDFKPMINILVKYGAAGYPDNISPNDFGAWIKGGWLKKAAQKLAAAGAELNLNDYNTVPETSKCIFGREFAIKKPTAICRRSLIFKYKKSLQEEVKYLLSFSKSDGKNIIPDEYKRILDIEKEYRLMYLLHKNRYLPVPKLMRLEKDIKFFGRPFFIQKYLKGSTLNNLLASKIHGPQKEELINTYIDSLIQVHSLPKSKFYFLPLLSRPSKLLDSLVLKSDYLNFVKYKDLIDKCFSILKGYKIPPAKETLLHGNFHPDNIFMENGKLSGIADWEHAKLGDPLFELAELIVTSPWPKYDQKILFERYIKNTKRSRENLDFYIKYFVLKRFIDSIAEGKHNFKAIEENRLIVERTFKV